MKIVIVGAPKTGKSLLAREIGTRLHSKALLRIYDTLPPLDDEPAVGPSADYRHELAIAVERMWWHLEKQFEISVSIMTNSLLTSLAHAGLILNAAAQVLSEDELDSYAGTFWMINHLTLDSWTADKILFLPGNDGDPFNVELEHAYEEILASLDQPFDTVEGEIEQEADKYAKIILEELGVEDDLDGPRKNLS